MRAWSTFMFYDGFLYSFVGIDLRVNIVSSMYTILYPSFLALVRARSIFLFS